MKKLALLMIAVIFTAGAASAQTAGFEDLQLDPGSYWNGSNGSGGFTSQGVHFNNNYNFEYESWDGFAYSNLTDTEAEGYEAQYNAIPGSGANGSETYAIVYWSDIATEPPTITLDEEQEVSGMYVTNNNYAYYAMLDGDPVFGLDPYDQDDWLKVTATGYNSAGIQTDSVDIYLAQSGDIVDTWQWVDFGPLGIVEEIRFSMSSSDTGEWGMNTPSYFAIDDFNGPAPGSGNEDSGSSSGGCFIETLDY